MAKNHVTFALLIHRKTDIPFPVRGFLSFNTDENINGITIVERP